MDDNLANWLQRLQDATETLEKIDRTLASLEERREAAVQQRDDAIRSLELIRQKMTAQ